MILRARLALALLVLACGFAAWAQEQVQVRPGDTLYALAQRFDTTVDALKAANGLEGDLLRVGQRLRLPVAPGAGYRSVTALPGDTLAIVAERAGLDPSSLSSANPGLSPGADLAGAPVALPPEDGETVWVRAGDSLLSLAAGAGLSPAEVARVNGLEPPYALEPGQALLLPGLAPGAGVPSGGRPAPSVSDASPATAPTPGASPPAAPRSAPAVGAGDPAAGGGRTDGALASASFATGAGPTAFLAAPPADPADVAVPVGARASAAADPRETLRLAQIDALRAALTALPGVRWGAVGFRAPLQGVISSRFGWRALTVNGNHYHGGVDLAAPWGTEVDAARDGVVVKAGWGGTYGQTVFLDHGDGSQTRYAHLSRILVRVGQALRQGDALGEVGSTGASTGPHLHFELRFDGRAVDPLAYLEGLGER